ncbi:GNAT family protein [Halalkalibacterium halodurans]|uniref:GNAT family N-acetyltransferase n=2 Tax=Halalkalibacterium halodurans TaxID=86665 RepID=UPI002AAA3720|nr:GNAT family protein [Halalkalibacterium halodurans]MDY7222680.1 GNAT family protein [Halalkalibacterium halodurans]MDY7241901.1 GNAT family protein [Halalkalibacterium halodurans]MED4081097.1 GNAT family protein [Halalkalibacterium halodurans]MED4085738.1 GNAT family protein [Halalkalibacterium halodurans]MED4106447.1 GNAT family protein [Halalkalibacterium halodurans]
MLFDSKRIRLRKMEKGDVPLYHSWRNDIEMMSSTNPNLDQYSLEETLDFVETIILGSSSSKAYMIHEKEMDVTIGITSLINIDYKNRNAECIIDIGEKTYWGKGYGFEALRLLLNYAFLEMNLHRVSLRVFSFNKKAIRLYEKLGFKHEGTSRQCLYRYGQWHDIVHMGILKDEYKCETTF